MHFNGSSCFVISIKHISSSELPGVLESVLDTFNVKSVVISRSDPVPSFFVHRFKSEPDLPSYGGRVPGKGGSA